MNPQVQQLIEAGYVTRKQAAAILGKGDGGNIVALCKSNGVKFIEIKRGTKTTTLFWERDILRLLEKMCRKDRPKIVKEGNKVRGGTIAVDGEARVPIQCELPVAKNVALPEPPGQRLPQDTFFTPPNMQKIVEDSLRNESEVMLALGRIEAMLTALLKRKDIK